MDQLLPDLSVDVDAASAYGADARPAGPDRPWVAVNMVASADGAVTVDGRSGGLSGPADKAIFFALRAVADVVLVGAGTVRAENYGPPRLSEGARAQREARGQAPFPTMAVVSGRLDLQPEARIFVDSPTRPMILTSATSDHERRRALQDVADVVIAGEHLFEPALAMGLLHQRGARVVVCEGGPTLNGSLLDHDVVDELCLSMAPLLASGDDPRVTRGPTLAPPRPLVLDRLLVEDGFTFFRYLVAR